MSVIAEGAETAAQRDHLRDLGFRLARGYFFGRPVPTEESGRLPEGAEGAVRTPRSG